MKSYAGFIVILIMIWTKSAGQSASVLIGARSAGLANASASLKDSWAIYNNPAGSAKLTRASLNITCDNRPSLVGANRAAVCIVLPTRAGIFTAGVFKFGDDLYSEQLLSAAYSHSLGLASLGARIDYIQYRAEGYDPVVAIGVTAGTIADITDRLSLGGYVSNLNRPLLPDGQAVPVRMATGFEFRPTDKVSVCGEVEKDSGFSPTCKAGIEVTPFRKVNFRTGFNLYPNAAFAGIGFSSWQIRFDYAISFTPSFGYAHQACLSLLNKQRDKKK